MRHSNARGLNHAFAMGDYNPVARIANCLLDFRPLQQANSKEPATRRRCA